jgi:hypothetical protein
MGGTYILKSQVEFYMKARTEKNLTQESAAAKTGISIRSGRTIEKGYHYTNKVKKPRIYKTRMSPIDEVWESVLEPMLKANPDLQPKSLFLYLQRTYTDSSGYPIYTSSVERSVQRKVAKWLALNGKSKEVMFPQEHIPGEQGLSDFTHFKNTSITIKGSPFKHMFYHFRLVYSKWSYLKVIRSGESMQALSEGLQEALFTLGGVPKEHRTDSLSAAFKNLSKEALDDQTTRYKELCEYYNMLPTRNNKGKGHENGSVESSHGHLKNRIAQELILRCSTDFDSVEDYEQWIHDIVKASNSRNCVDLDTEKLALQRLPRSKTADYELRSATVTTMSLVRIKGLFYSVPSRLSGHTLTVHIYQSDIDFYLGSTHTFRVKRRYSNKHSSEYVINYKHIIHSLIRKPAAFRKCKYRQEILPNDEYRFIWSYLDKKETNSVAPKIMLRLLKLAADNSCEQKLSDYVIELIENNKLLDIELIESRFNFTNSSMPKIECKQHDIGSYDAFVTITPGARHATV